MSKFDMHVSLPDGGLIRTNKAGEWNLRLPNGKYRMGTERTQAAAKAEAEARHREYVYQRWMKGRPGRLGGYVCPID